jgi:hypothetical protein
MADTQITAGQVLNPRVYGRILTADAWAVNVDDLAADAVRQARETFGGEVTLEVRPQGKIVKAGEGLGYRQSIDVGEVLEP